MTTPKLEAWAVTYEYTLDDDIWRPDYVLLQKYKDAVRYKSERDGGNFIRSISEPIRLVPADSMFTQADVDMRSQIQQNFFNEAINQRDKLADRLETAAIYLKYALTYLGSLEQRIIKEGNAATPIHAGVQKFHDDIRTLLKTWEAADGE